MKSELERELVLFGIGIAMCGFAGVIGALCAFFHGC